MSRDQGTILSPLVTTIALAKLDFGKATTTLNVIQKSSLANAIVVTSGLKIVP